MVPGGLKCGRAGERCPHSQRRDMEHAVLSQDWDEVDGNDEKWRKEDKIGGGPQGERWQPVAETMQDQQKNDRKRGGKGDWPRDVRIENGESCSDEKDRKSEKAQVTEGEASCGVDWVIGVATRTPWVVFPGVDEEAVEAA